MHDTTTAGDAQLSELEKYILANAEELAFPATDWEAETLKEIMALPRVIVVRPPESDLLAIGMRRNHCHENCAVQAANDTDGQSRHVSGWYVSGSDLILHSVAEIGGQWFCLTPQTGKSATRFEFIPDPAIEWQASPDGRELEAFRVGHKLPQALRESPEEHIQLRDRFHALMASGMSAIEARDVINATAGQQSRETP